MRLSSKHTVNWATTFTETFVDAIPMNKTEFQISCTALHIDDSLTAAKAFGLSWRTCQRYWYGKLDVPGPLARLLRLAVKHHVTVAELSGVAPKGTRHKSDSRL